MVESASGDLEYYRRLQSILDVYHNGSLYSLKFFKENTNKRILFLTSLLLAHLDSVYSLVWGGHQIWRNGMI